MTKKKDLKFKVGDRAQVVSAPTWGKKSHPWRTSGGAKVGESYFVTANYGDGDYDLGTELGPRAATFRGVVHQRHLALVDDLGDKIETEVVSPWGNHMHVIGGPAPYAALPPGVGDIVVIKDEVEVPTFSSWASEHSTHLARINKDQRYRVFSDSQEQGANGKRRIWLGILGEANKDRRAGLIDADQVRVLRPAWQVKLDGTMKELAGLYTDGPITSAPKLSVNKEAKPTGVDPAYIRAVLNPDPIVPAPPKKPTWHDVQAGDRVTAKTTIRIAGVDGDSVVTHTDLAGPKWVSGIRFGDDLYWRDLNLTVHRDYDSWQIVSIEKARDWNPPAPKPLEERRKPGVRVRVERVVPDDGFWVRPPWSTGNKFGVVETRTNVDNLGDYWVFFNDKTKVRLEKGRDKVFVQGQERDYDDAESKTHNPA